MTKLCWIEHASEAVQAIKIADILKGRGYETDFVCKTRDTERRYKEARYNTFFIADIFSETDEWSDEALTTIDMKYGPPGIRVVGDSDVQIKAYFGRNERDKQLLIARALRYWERFFSERKTECVIARETATFATRSAYVVARRRGIPLFWIAVGPNDNHFMMNDIAERYDWSELPNLLAQLPDAIAKSEKKIVDEYIREKYASHASTTTVQHSVSSIATSLKNWAGLALRAHFGDRSHDPVKIAAYAFGAGKLLKQIVWRYLTGLFFVYDTPQDEPFVYLPVYSGEEAEYLTNDHFWARNEVALIREVAASLPVGYFLYVKEHPRNPGDLTFRQLRELKRMRNVRVLRPQISGVDLIKRAGATITLWGTTGWEAFLLKKPVVVLGSPFYTRSDLVYTAHNISFLAETLWRAIKEGSSRYEQRIDEWYRFIYAVLSTCGKGTLVRYSPPYGFPVDEENVRSMAEQIGAKIDRLTSKRASPV